MDRGFLYGSIATIFLWLLAPDGSNLVFFSAYPITNYFICIIGYVSVAILFAAGELDRIDKPLRVPRFNFVKYPIFVVGLVSFGIWLISYRTKILENLASIFSDSISILLGILLILLVSLVVIKWQTRAGKTPAVV